MPSKIDCYFKSLPDSIKMMIWLFRALRYKPIVLDFSSCSTASKCDLNLFPIVKIPPVDSKSWIEQKDTFERKRGYLLYEIESDNQKEEKCIKYHIKYNFGK